MMGIVLNLRASVKTEAVSCSPTMSTAPGLTPVYSSWGTVCTPAPSGP